MRAVVQRVKKANVKVDNNIVGSINQGLLVLLAISGKDDQKIIEWMANKLINLRIFSDDEGKMNKSVNDVNGGILMISNFTLYGDASKGFRPSFIQSAPPEISKPLYYQLLKYMRDNHSIIIEDGEFGAMMDVELINDGPVTIIIEKEN